MPPDCGICADIATICHGISAFTRDHDIITGIASAIGLGVVLYFAEREENRYRLRRGLPLKN